MRRRTNETMRAWWTWYIKKRMNPVSLALELVWLICLVPGIVYSVQGSFQISTIFFQVGSASIFSAIFLAVFVNYFRDRKARNEHEGNNK